MLAAIKVDRKMILLLLKVDLKAETLNLEVIKADLKMEMLNLAVIKTMLKEVMPNLAVIKAETLNLAVIKTMLKKVMLKVVIKMKHQAAANGKVEMQKKVPNFSKLNVLNVIVLKKVEVINKDLIFSAYSVDTLVKFKVLITAMLIKTKILRGAVIHFGFI